MTRHRVTPYRVTATRKFVRDEKRKREELLLASISDESTVDLLDVVSDHVENVTPVESKHQQQSVRCVASRRAGDRAVLVFASYTSGGVETIYDEEGNVALPKTGKHVSRNLSVCLLWRPPDGTQGVLLVHSPYGRGGSRSSVMKLLQRAMNEPKPGPKAKLHADPMIPQKALLLIIDLAPVSRSDVVRTTGGTGAQRRGGLR